MFKSGVMSLLLIWGYGVESVLDLRVPSYILSFMLLCLQNLVLFCRDVLRSYQRLRGGSLSHGPRQIVLEVEKLHLRSCQFVLRILSLRAFPFGLLGRRKLNTKSHFFRGSFFSWASESHNVVLRGYILSLLTVNLQVVMIESFRSLRQVTRLNVLHRGSFVGLRVGFVRDIFPKIPETERKISVSSFISLHVSYSSYFWNLKFKGR